MSLAAATRLGPYEILGPLGSGGMGEVYRARDTRLGREVAIKVLPEAFAHDPERLARFEREARAVAALSHPNLLAIHDFGTTPEGIAYAVTELLEGETLRARLAHGALPVRRALEYAVQVAHGLAAAHDKGIVHRDLKPENLWVGPDGRVKVLDFGLAKQAGPVVADSSAAPTATLGTAAGLVVGTAGYMSPEQVRGQPVDARTDLFSFGAVLYEMLSGRRAFVGDTAADTMSAILREDPPELSRSVADLPAGLERIVARCLEKSPGARFQSAHDLAFALEALVAPSTGSGKAPALRAAPALRIRRVAPVLGLGALALLGLGLIAGRSTAPRRFPAFRVVSFQRGFIHSARFAPDHQTILYGAAFAGEPVAIHSTSADAPDSRLLDLPGADVVGIARTGDMAILLGRHHAGGWERVGTLAQVPLAGGSPRPILEQVYDADIAPTGDRLAIVRAWGSGRQLEYPIGQVLFRTQGWIALPRISADGRRVAFVVHPFRDDDIGYVAVADGDGRVRRLSPDAEFSQGLAWSPRQDEIWASSLESEGPEIWAVRPGHPGRRVLFRSPAPIRIHDVAPDGRALVTEDAPRAEIIGRLAGDDRERTYSWWGNDMLGGMAADGSLFVANAYMRPSGGGYLAYLRRSDHRPPVHMGMGVPFAVARDGSFALITGVEQGRDTLRIVPTGAGLPREIPLGRIQIDLTGNLPQAGVSEDRRRVAFIGIEPGHAPRAYVLALAGGPPRAVTSEGVRSMLLTPDGSTVSALYEDGRVLLHPVAGGPAKAVPGLLPGEAPVAWDATARGLLVWDRSFPIRVTRVDVATGARSHFRDITPEDPAGILYGSLCLAPDGSSYLYRVRRYLSGLDVVIGLR